MALVYGDRVKETTTTTGTGTYTLAGAATGFQSFGSVLSNSDTCYYTVTDGTDWEVGLGTYTTAGTTLARTSIQDSSNAGAAVNWGAGTKDVFLTIPATTAALASTALQDITTESILDLSDVANTALSIGDLLQVNLSGNLEATAISATPLFDKTADDTDDITEGATNKFASTSNVDAAGAVMNTDTSTASMSFVVDEDNMSSNSATKLSTQQSIKAYVDAEIASAKSALYPVGSYYINETDSTNPGTLLGFGTWVAVADKFIVGKGSGTFATAGSTGGAETVDSSHTHGLTAAYGKWDLTATTTYAKRKATASWTAGNQQTGQSWGGSSTSRTTAMELGGTTDSGGSSTLDILPPYIVAYIWKRTA